MLGSVLPYRSVVALVFLIDLTCQVCHPSPDLLPRCIGCKYLIAILVCAAAYSLYLSSVIKKLSRQQQVVTKVVTKVSTQQPLPALHPARPHTS